MITIKNARVLYGENMEVHKANILIEDDKIVEVSEHAHGGRVVDASGCIVAPGLINSHIHIGDSVAKDVGDGQHIDKIVKPPDGIKHRILNETPPEKIIESMRDSMRHMLETGTTTFIDFREGGFEGIELLEEASRDIPIRKIVLGRHDSFMDPEVETSNVRKTAKKLLRSCDGIGLSGFGEIRDDVALEITKTCKKYGKISSIHAAEYGAVQRQSLKTSGNTEVQRALKTGFDLLVHLTSPLDDDLKVTGLEGVPVVSCPRSNGALSVGIPPIKEMMDNNINLLLGTDNVMFNSPNMFHEMEYALKATRGLYKEYLSPVDVFKMATVNAARALNLNSGYIQEDKVADLIIVKQISENPVLSLINRAESKNIIGLITESKLI
ncbi:5'-deoxyadenosine deaminase [anaerobic digester metagenome]